MLETESWKDGHKNVLNFFNANTEGTKYKHKKLA